MNIRRGFIITVIIALLLSCTVSAKGKFTDVKDGKWYYDEVMRAYDEGIMVGVSDSEFAPDDTVTREMFVTALSRIAMARVEEYHETRSVFSDVKTDKWYSDAIEWAATDGIVYGVSDDRFGLGEAVTREQIAAFVTRFLNVYLYDIAEAEKQAGEFVDNPSKYAADAVELMRKTGLISGKGGGKFAPKENATRAEVAAILLRLKDAIAECGYSFKFDAGDISQIGVFCDVYTKDIVLTTDSDIERFIEYLNAAPIASAEFIGHAAGWDHSISLYDGGGDKVFTLCFTESFFIINECLYTVEGDYFKPLVDAVK